MTTTTTLAPPLVVFSGIGYCDTKHEHETRISTDGIRAYCSGPHTDNELIARDGVTLTVDCGQPTGLDEEPCTGQVLFRLDTEGGWTADPDAIAQVTAWGQVMDR